MNWTIIILIGAQLLFTTSDLLGRTYMIRYGFSWVSLWSLWFLVYMFIRTIATIGQLYVFSNIELGKTMALFGAVSIILANGIGFLVLNETLSPVVYIGISLAIIAFILLAVS